MIKVQNEQAQVTIAKVYRAGQEHIFRFWDELERDQQGHLLEQIEMVDFQELARLIENVVSGINLEAPSSLETYAPAKVFPFSGRSNEQDRRATEARELGENAIREGRLGVVTVAGGAGTRLGYDGPKGSYPIGPLTKKSLFEIFAERIQAASRRYKVTIPWLIMVSSETEQATEAFFGEHGFFGLQKSDVLFMSQREMPVVDRRGKILLAEKYQMVTSPNGHGGTIHALADSGAFEDLKRRGCDILSYHQVDNPLIHLVDPFFVGLFLGDNSQVGMKIVRKRDPEEKMGVVCFRNGRLACIEYSELGDEQRYERDQDDQLMYGAGNIAVHLFQREFLEGLAGDENFVLGYHKALKKVQAIDRDGEVVEPKQPNGIKFESFIFDCLAGADQVTVVEVDRREEFAPLKNKEGENSIEQVHKAMSNRFGAWLEKTGIEIPRAESGDVKGVIEISPLFADSHEELSDRIDPDLRFDGELNLE